jgi:hypothetical protein
MLPHIGIYRQNYNTGSHLVSAGFLYLNRITAPQWTHPEILAKVLVHKIYYHLSETSGYNPVGR